MRPKSSSMKKHQKPSPSLWKKDAKDEKSSAKTRTGRTSEPSGFREPGQGTGRLAGRGSVQVLDSERSALGVTLYVCSKCNGVVTLAYSNPQVCRSCFIAKFPTYQAEEIKRVGKPTELVTVVFPDGRIVKMSATGENREIKIEDSMKDFGKLKRKFREDVTT